MGYTMLRNGTDLRSCPKGSLEGEALRFIRDCCEGLRFDSSKAADIRAEGAALDREGRSLGAGQIPLHIVKCFLQ